MREHAIPQDVVGYRFHIIGNMTLKQFLEVGAGCIAGVMIYATNLHPIIKWPFIGLSVAVGAMAAFVPFEERPFDHWLVTFARVLYKPTKFFWKKEPKIPDAFLFQSSSQTTLTVELDLTPARRQRIKEYITSLDAPLYLDPTELAEQQRMAAILASFQEVTVTTSTRSLKPSLTMKPHSLKKLSGDEPEVSTVGVQQLEDTVAQTAPVVPEYQFDKPVLAVSAVAQHIQIPETQAINLKVAEADQAQTAAAPETVQTATFVNDQPVVTTPTAATQNITTNTDLPFPVKPTEPNKLVGMILSPTNDLINDAIVEIQTDQGSVVRAVKSNALGQFFITTPLPNGTYTVLVEKDGFAFAPLQLQMTGAVMAPLEIRSN